MADQDWLTPATVPAPSPYQKVIEAPSVAPPAYELRPLTLGELLDRTFSLYRSRFWLFCGIAVMAALVELVMGGIGRVVVHHYTKEPGTIYSADVGITYLASFIYFFVYCVTQAATTFAMAEVYLGRPASIGPSLRAVRGKWYAWIGIGLWQAWSAGWVFFAMFIPFVILAGLKVAIFGGAGGGILMGFLVLLVAAGAMVYGAIAYIRNSLGIPVKVMEGLSVRKSMRRSKDMAAGAKGRIFVLGLIVFAMNMVFGVAQAPFALMTLYARSGTHVFAEMAALLITFAAHASVTPIASIGLCLIYFDQRVRREAFDLEILLGPEPTSAPPSFSSASEPNSEASPNAGGEAQTNAPLL
jgi:hypothetical protein